MASCSQCGSETELFVIGVPICIKCGMQNEHDGANNELTAARHDYERARQEFYRLLQTSKDLPNGHPDGTALLHAGNQVLHEAGRKLSKALVRYQDILLREPKK
jgi:hypothetical protein